MAALTSGSVTVYCEVCFAVLDPQVSILTTCGHLACSACHTRANECPVCVKSAGIVAVARVPSHLQCLFVSADVLAQQHADAFKTSAQVRGERCV